MKRKVAFMFINGDLKEAQRAVMKTGEKGELLAISGSWYKIKNDGLTGYVSKSKVKPIK